MIKIMINKIKWWFKMKYQKLTRGFTDEELWNLDYTFIVWILPRLKEFKKRTVGYPPLYQTHEEWIKDLDKMINAFEMYIQEDSEISFTSPPYDSTKVCEGFELFAKRIHNLWW